MTKRLLVALMMLFAAGFIACDSPRENAVEERIEDQGEAAGQSEDAAEERGEAVSEGEAPATDTVLTDTSATTAATATTSTTGTY